MKKVLTTCGCLKVSEAFPLGGGSCRPPYEGSAFDTGKAGRFCSEFVLYTCIFQNRKVSVIVVFIILGWLARTFSDFSWNKSKEAQEKKYTCTLYFYYFLYLRFLSFHEVLYTTFYVTYITLLTSVHTFYIYLHVQCTCIYFFICRFFLSCGWVILLIFQNLKGPKGCLHGIYLIVMVVVWPT